MALNSPTWASPVTKSRATSSHGGSGTVKGCNKPFVCFLFIRSPCARAISRNFSQTEKLVEQGPGSSSGEIRDLMDHLGLFRAKKAGYCGGGEKQHF